MTSHYYAGVTRPLTRAMKTRWVEELRGDNFRQGHGSLRNSDFTPPRYCCLGVANELFGLGARWERGALRTDGDRETLLLPRETQAELIHRNDTLLWTFPKIADWIEEHVPCLEETTHEQETTG